MSAVEDQLLISKVSFRRLDQRNSMTDQESIPTIDQIPTSRPTVAMLDKLWSQIDVLDDVRAMAETVRKQGGFFLDKKSSNVCHVKEAQENFLRKVISHQKVTARTHDIKAEGCEGHEGLSDRVSKQEVSAPQESMVQIRMADFFASPPELASYNSQLQDFDELEQYIVEVHQRLNVALEEKKQIEDERSRLW